MAKRFAEHGGLNLTQVNNGILQMWKDKNVFLRSIDEREGCPQFVFFEGPPSANGHPGIHHVLARSIKDTFNRYKTMQGYQVNRKAGWDTHGLPVEIEVEKVPILNGAEELARFGFIPEGMYNNLDWVQGKVYYSPSIPLAKRDLMLDPQTSGGLLFFLPQEDAETLLKRLNKEYVKIIGRVKKKGQYGVEFI